MDEVLTSHPIRCVNAFRMEPQLLLRLCKDLSTKYGLKASDNMCIINLSERFQRSGDTISRVIHEVLNSISSRSIKGLAHYIIRPYDPNFNG
ncbi:Citrate synthase 1, partial [Bienertia sinuspersici]